MLNFPPKVCEGRVTLQWKYESPVSYIRSNILLPIISAITQAKFYLSSNINDRQTDRQTDRPTNTHTHTHTHNANLPRNERSLLSRLLCGVLPLEIEIGRFRRPKKERHERYCRTCNTQKVEDELHFVFECKALTEVREERLKPLVSKDPALNKAPNAEKLTWLTKAENIKEFGKVLACLFQRRQDIHFKKH